MFKKYMIKVKDAYRSNHDKFERQLEDLLDVKSQELSDSCIPPNCYQTWETKSLYRTHLRGVQDFRNLNPDLSWFLYDSNDSQKYMEKFYSKHPILEIYNRAKFGVMKADIFRYCILFQRGGYYFDINKSCNIQLSKLHSKNADALISFEKNICTIPSSPESMNLLKEPFKYAVQWGFGFAPGHIVLAKTLDNIVASYPYFKEKIFERPQTAILAMTGPGVFTKSLRESIPMVNLNKLAQHSSDFSNSGVFRIKGSDSKTRIVKHYSTYSNQMIVS